MDLHRWSARSLPRDPSSVQGLEYTAKGDEGALEPGGHVLDSAEGSPGDASPPAHADSEEAARARQEEPGTAAAEALETSAPVAQQLESLSTISGMGSSAWTMGNRITHWRLAHQRGYHLDQLTQDKTYRRRVRKHENNCKAAVPLPLLELMEEEVLAILTETLKDYRRRLGARHPLTHQMEQRMQQLRQQLEARSTGAGGGGQPGPPPCASHSVTPQAPLHPNP